jgi:hypothetical protein
MRWRQAPAFLSHAACGGSPPTLAQVGAARGVAFFDPRGADAPAFEAVVGVSTICSLSPRGSGGHDELERLAMSSRAIMLMRSFRAFFSAPIRPAMTTIDGSTWQALRAGGRGFVKVTNRDDASLIACRKPPVVCEFALLAPGARWFGPMA